MTKLTLKAYAKINLTLEVVGRREDGYHDIVSILQTVDLTDTLSLERADALAFDCDVEELRGGQNLVLKAATLLKDEAGYAGGASIHLEKGIPVSAGLGGGSSDAATALKGLNDLWGLGLSVEELTPLAAKLGSDVPFFLHGGTAMVQGRGERVRPLPPADVSWVVILTPQIAIPEKTAAMYGGLAENDFTRGMLTRKLEARIRGGGDVPPQFLFNAFDTLARGAFPGLKEYWERFEALGAQEVHVAGSGPSLFSLVPQREVGTAMSLMLEHRHGWRSHLASAVQPAKGQDE